MPSLSAGLYSAPAQLATGAAVPLVYSGAFLPGASVLIIRSGTGTAPTYADGIHAVLYADAGYVTPLANPLPVAAGPGMPGVDAQSNLTFYSDSTYAYQAVVSYLGAHIPMGICLVADAASLQSETSRAIAAESAVAGSAAGAAQKAANLSDLSDKPTARTNLGLGTAATHPATDFDTAGLAGAAQAFAIQRTNHTGTQAPSTITGTAVVTGDARLSDTRTPTDGTVTTAKIASGGLAATAVTGTALIATQLGAASGVASLGSDGKLTAGQLPAIAVTSTTVVGSQAAMLALAVHQGAVAIRTDFTPRVAYILTTDDPTQLANWQALDPATTVTDVNGASGSVSIPADPIAATAGLRTLGTGANQAAPGATSAQTDPTSGVIVPAALPPAMFAPYVDHQAGSGGVVVPTLTFQTVFGIEAGTGRPYYKADGALPGEEALLGSDLSLTPLPFQAPPAAAVGLTQAMGDARYDPIGAAALEAIRALAAEAANSAAVTSEATTARAAETANTALITSEAATARAAEAAKLALAGGTLTGPVVLAGPPAAPLNPASKVYADQYGFMLAMGGGLLSWDTFARGDRDLTTDTAPSGETYVTIANGQLKAYIAGGMMTRSATSTFGGSGAAFAYSPHAVQPKVAGALFRFTPFDVNTPGTPATTRGQNAVVGLTPSLFSNPSSIQFAVWPDIWQLFYTHFNGVSTDIVVLQSGTWATPLVVDDATAYFAVMRVDSSTTPNWTVRCEVNGVLVTTYTGSEVQAYVGVRQGTQIRHQATTDGDVRVLARAASAPLPVPVSSVAGRTGAVVIAEGDVTGLATDLATSTANVATNATNIGATQAVQATQAFMQRRARGQSAVMLIVGDSTGDTGSGSSLGDPTRWPAPFATLIAADWAAYTTVTYQWQDSLSGTPYVWLAPTVVQAGPGGLVTHAATGTSASNVITDASIAAPQSGYNVIGKNIPPGSTVGVVTAGASFTLLDALGNAVLPWGAVTSIQVGADPILAIYNASVGGTRWLYGFGPYADAMYGRIQPDLIVANHGHNEIHVAGGTAPPNAYEVFWHCYLDGVEMLTALCPAAQVILIGQNPRTDTYSGDPPIKSRMVAEIAAARGYGYVDIYQTFIDHTNWAVDWMTASSPHPSATGSAALAAELYRHFVTPATRRMSPRPRQVSLFQQAASEQLVADGLLLDWPVSGIPSGWTLSSATITKDTTTFPGVTTAKVISSAVLGNVQIPLDIAKVAGQVITVTAHVRYQDSSSAKDCGGFAFRYIDGAGGAHTFNSGFGAGNALDTWYFQSLSQRIPADATSAYVWLYGDALNSTAPTWYRSIKVTRGRMPAGLVALPTPYALVSGAVTDQLVSTTAAIQPSKVSGLKAYFTSTGAIFPGSTGNYFSTPSAAANRVTGNLELQFKIAAGTSTRSAGNVALIAKWGAVGHRCYVLGLTTAGAVSLTWAADGTTAIITNSGAGVLAATLASDTIVRAQLNVNNAGVYTVNFATSTDGGTTWPALGTQTTGGAPTSIFDDATQPVEIGSVGGGTSQFFAGTGIAANICSTLGGAAVQSWSWTDPTAATYTATTGEVWTMAGSFTFPATVTTSLLTAADATKLAAALTTAFQRNVTAVKTANYTAVNGDVVRVDASGGAVTVTVPIAANTDVIIKNVGATGTVTVQMASGTIDGAATITLPRQYQAREIIADGTNGVLV